MLLSAHFWAALRMKSRKWTRIQWYSCLLIRNMNNLVSYITTQEVSTLLGNRRSYSLQSFSHKSNISYNLYDFNNSPYFRSFSTHNPSTPTITYHRRVLPDCLTALSSSKGRQMFKESLDNGTMECYFPLSEQFITQSEPSYCSLSSLAMVLNALNHDPKKTWKGVWRWVSEENLLCNTKHLCRHSSDQIHQNGMNFEDFVALQHCQPGIGIQSFRVTVDDDQTLFRSLILKSCQAIKHDSFIICNYSRTVLQQTGDGHYSPIGGYHQGSDSVLILDVARFKYPPYWVPVDLLWQAMKAIDPKSNLSRGYFLVSSQFTNSTSNSASYHSPSTPSSNSSSSCNHHLHTNNEVRNTISEFPLRHIN